MMRKSLLLLGALASPLAAQNAPVLFETSRTTPVTAGQWSYAQTASGSDALFAGRLLIRCDRNARRVTLRRIEPIAIQPATAMTITTDLGTRTIPLNGVVLNSDRVLDAIAFSRGRFIVSGGGNSFSLIIPASPEAARSIEDCRI